MNNDPVQMLWWPSLGEMERMSVRSYLAHGNEVHLYSYGHCEGVPAGASIHDAADIVPLSDGNRFDTVANFADWFRYNLLLKKGGWWADIDSVCLRNLDTIENEVVLTQEDIYGPSNPSPEYRRETVEPFCTNAFIRFPAGHPIMAWLVGECAKREHLDYLATGPTLTTEAMKKFGITPLPSVCFNYLNWWEWNRLFSVPAFEVPSEAYAIHMYRYTLRHNKMYNSGDVPANSFYGKMRRKYAPRVLVAVNSCWKDIHDGSNDAILDTWAPYLPREWDLAFFVGDRDFTVEERESTLTDSFMGSPGGFGVAPLGLLKSKGASSVYPGSPGSLGENEIVLEDTPDNYIGLPFKTVNSLRWALAKGYDYIFRAFTDTYIMPDRLAASGFEDHDATGWLWYCQPCPAHPESTHSSPLGGAGYWLSARAARIVVDHPVDHWAEDALVGYALSKGSLKWSHDPRYPHDPEDNPVLWKDRITKHLGGVREEHGPALMLEAHRMANDARLSYDGSRDALANRSKMTIHLGDRGRKWNPSSMLAAHREQEAGRALVPAWDGKCAQCGSMTFLKHPLGLRCRMCGWKAE